jgi:hypothetical protein
MRRQKRRKRRKLEERLQIRKTSMQLAPIFAAIAPDE